MKITFEYEMDAEEKETLRAAYKHGGGGGETFKEFIASHAWAGFHSWMTARRWEQLEKED